MESASAETSAKELVLLAIGARKLTSATTSPMTTALGSNYSSVNGYRLPDTCGRGDKVGLGGDSIRYVAKYCGKAFP